MTIAPFIKTDYTTISPYSGTFLNKSKLLKAGALVVIDDDAELGSTVIGVLTPDDILRKPFNLVIDCLSQKPVVSSNELLEEAVIIMLREDAEVLPVYSDDKFEGILFRSDLVKFIASQRSDDQSKIVENSVILASLNKKFEISKQALIEICHIQSHETRQPVATILGLLNLMDGSLLSEQNKEILEMLTTTCEKLDVIIKGTVIKANHIYDRVTDGNMTLSDGGQ